VRIPTRTPQHKKGTFLKSFDTFAADWLKRDALGTKLIDSKIGEVFRHLKLFWDKVNGLTPEAATVFLQVSLRPVVADRFHSSGFR